MDREGVSAIDTSLLPEGELVHFLVAEFHESRRLYEEKVPQKWVGTIGGCRGDQAKIWANCCDNVFRAFNPKCLSFDKLPARVGILHFELAVRDLPFIVVKGNAMLIEEGNDLFPVMVDAVGWVATEKPSLLEHFRGADLLGVEVESISH